MLKKQVMLCGFVSISITIGLVTQSTFSIAIRDKRNVQQEPIPTIEARWNWMNQKSAPVTKAKKLVKSNKSKILFREIAFLTVLNFFPVQKLIFGHF